MEQINWARNIKHADHLVSVCVVRRMMLLICLEQIRKQTNYLFQKAFSKGNRTIILKQLRKRILIS